MKRALYWLGEIIAAVVLIAAILGYGVLVFIYVGHSWLAQMFGTHVVMMVFGISTGLLIVATLVLYAIHRWMPW